MAKKIVITLQSDVDELIDSGLDSFARASGFKEDLEQTQIEVAEKRLKAFFREVVVAYNKDKAQEQAAQAAEDQSTQALDLITLSVVVEDVA